MIKEGWTFSAVPAVAGGLCMLFGWGWLAALLIFFALFILYFFRDPNRTAPGDPGAVVSPADGRVVEIVDEEWNGQPGRRISIFLSIWDVHVQRAPLPGTIRAVDYRPGKFRAAWERSASSENEQNVITLSTPRGDIMFKQIAGWVARRVICWKQPGASVGLGERVGMIRFGSRVDIWLPPSAEIKVRKGQFVAGATSILAIWN